MTERLRERRKRMPRERTVSPALRLGGEPVTEDVDLAETLTRSPQAFQKVICDPGGHA